MKRLKYLLVFTLPLSVGISFEAVGWLSYLPVYIFFVLVPLLELILPSKWQTNTATEQSLQNASMYYDFLLYALVVVQWLFLIYFLANQHLAPDQTTWWGRAVSMGIMCVALLA